MKFCVLSETLNLPYHFQWDNGVISKFSAKEPLDYDKVGFLVKRGTLDTLKKLFLVDEMPTFPSKNYIKALQGVVNNTTVECIPWSFCVPAKALVGLVVEFLGDLSTVLEAIGEPGLNYYSKVYLRAGRVLESLQPVWVDSEAVERLALTDATKAVETFKPQRLLTFMPGVGVCPPVIYSRTSSVSGRLTVDSGPNILRLKRALKKEVMRSRFGKEGAIYELDYKALEPRAILAHNRPDLVADLPLDIYEFVRTSMFQGMELSREDVKQIVISRLYGAGYDTLSLELKHVRDLSGVMEAINSYFGLREMQDRLVRENDLNDRKFIHNFYGRKVSTVEAKSYMLPNSWGQSTAVDIALMGFGNIIDHVELTAHKTTYGIRSIVPVLVNHDALYLDTHKSAEHLLPELCKVGASGILGFEDVTFYIELKKVTENQ